MVEKKLSPANQIAGDSFHGISSFAPSYNSGMKALKNGIKLATMARIFIHITEIARAITEIISTKSFILLVFWVS